MDSISVSIKYTLIYILFGLILGIIIGIGIMYKPTYRGPSSTKVRKKIYRDKNGEYYRYEPIIMMK